MLTNCLKEPMKSLIEKAFFLKKLRLFNELELELLLAISEKLHEDDYDADEKIFSCGQVANRIYFIVQGNVEIFDDQSRRLSKLSSNHYFGDESLFNEQPRTYSAICKTDTLLLSLSRSHLLSIISECPSVAIALLQAYSKQLPCRFKETGLL
jgi:CRP/FNR family cyclic AMP-dependent transcriptional regulator